jgi:hypothetical protein
MALSGKGFSGQTEVNATEGYIGAICNIITFKETDRYRTDLIAIT